LAWWLPLPNPFGSVTINSNPMAQAHSDTIIFLSNSAPNGDYAFYQIALKSREQHRLAFHSEANPNARLSPDRSRVALIDHDGHLVVMMNDGSQRLCITCSIQDRVGSFSWRPDNQQLLFEQWEADGTTLYRIDADGHNVRRLTPPNVSDHSPSWSPDGTQIAFVSDSDGPRIFVMQADGSQRKQITNHTNAPGSVSVDANPAWSPDGERLVYVSSRPSGNDIYVISKNGLNEQQLTKGERASNPTWMHVQE
jgi:TolB protein